MQQESRTPRKRLFFALWPDEPVRAALHRQQRRLVSAGRPVARANLHLTLAFMGALTAEEQAAAEAAAAASRGQAFSLCLERAGRWRNGVQWLAPARPPAELSALQRCLTKALNEAGFRAEERAFRPHVTLARKVPPLPSADRPEPVNWFIDRYALVQSHTRPSGVEYVVLREWSLAGHEPGGRG